MIKNYMKWYYLANPRSKTSGIIPDEADRGGQLEWLNMSDTEKDPWIELAKKMKAEGTSMFSIQT